MGIFFGLGVKSQLNKSKSDLTPVRSTGPTSVRSTGTVPVLSRGATPDKYAPLFSAKNLTGHSGAGKIDWIYLCVFSLPSLRLSFQPVGLIGRRVEPTPRREGREKYNILLILFKKYFHLINQLNLQLCLWSQLCYAGMWVYIHHPLRLRHRGRRE